MAVSPAVRVGIIVFLALLVLIAVAFFIQGYRLFRQGYEVSAVFDDALGLTQGSQVRMAGVTIGQVREVTLNGDQRAVVHMQINKKYRIPEGSTFIIRVGVLIGERYVDIVPDRQAREFIKPGARVEGKLPVRIEDLLPKTQELIANLTEASESLKEVLADDELRARLDRSFANIERATARLDKTIAAIQGTVVSEQDEVRNIVSNVEIASEGLRDLAQELGDFAKRGELQESIGETLASARRAAESLERSTISLEQLVTAPEFQEDIRQTAAEAREAVQEARQVISRVGRIFGGGPALGDHRISTRETSLDALVRPDDGRFRATLSTTVPFKGDNFVKLGIFDVGAGNKLILQPGQTLNSRVDLRYGLYASRLGLGLDYAFSRKTYGSLNLYDPYEPRADFQAGYSVTDDWGLLLGVDDVFDENKVTLGVRLTR